MQMGTGPGPWVLWVGPRGAPAELGTSLEEAGAQLRVFADAVSAVAAATAEAREVAVAILTWDSPRLEQELQRLREALPQAQVLLASDAGVPRAIVAALGHGASGVLEFRRQTRQEIVGQIRVWMARAERERRERALLVRLRGLNEEFLRHVVTAQKRNLELEAQLQPPVQEDEGPPRVLIVDDEEVVREVLEQVLTRRGYRFQSANTGEMALSALEQGTWDLVISDKNLPGMSGLDVLRAVKERAPTTEFILMTGYASMDSAIEALNQGAVAYLEKPFEHVKVVADRIEAVLKRRRERTRHHQYLLAIKERNREFLEQYKAVRADLEAWLEGEPQA